MGVTEETLTNQFQEQVEEGYITLLKGIESGIGSLESASRQYQQLSNKDYFHSGSGQRVRQAILDARGGNI